MDPAYALCSLLASFLRVYRNFYVRTVRRAFLDVVIVGRQRHNGKLIRLWYSDLFPVEVIVAVGSGDGAVLCAGEHVDEVSEGIMNTQFESGLRGGSRRVAEPAVMSRAPLGT